MHTDDTLIIDTLADLDFTDVHNGGFWVLPDGRLLRLAGGPCSHDETAEGYADQLGKGGYAYRVLIHELGCVRFSYDRNSDEVWLNLHAAAVTIPALETTRAALSKLKQVVTYVNLCDESVEEDQAEKGLTWAEYRRLTETEGYAAVQRELGKLIRFHSKPGKEVAA
jgi:hypothetical protein